MKRLIVVLTLTACSTPSLNQGSKVSINIGEISKECAALGTVSGKGGGAFGGTISDEDLQTYAMNDMRNKAASMGATHVIPHGGGLSGGVWSSTTGSVTGTAYKCP